MELSPAGAKQKGGGRMQIGTKLKNARTASGLTQEQAAEALGVSRQTISNWENERSYPDIVSVIRMSDLYAISLDRLLKEEQPVKQTYMEYLEESTNVVRSRTKLSKIILVAVYLVLWAAAEVVFWFFSSGSDAMGFSVLFLWFLLPAAIFVLSLIIGVNGWWGRGKWLCALIFGVTFMLVPYSTFSVANMVAFHTFRWPDFPALGAGIAVSLAGLGLGTLIRHLRRKRNAANTGSSRGGQ